MVEQKRYVPKRGDLVWLTFNPQVGHEQSGRRPALVISPDSYNSKTNLAIFCPATSQAKGYPFEVIIPEGLPISGVILVDQVKSLDWKARKAIFIAALPESVVKEALTLLNLLIGE